MRALAKTAEPSIKRSSRLAIKESERLQQHFQGFKGFVPIEEAEFLSLLDICCDPSYQPGPHQSQVVMGLETPASLQARSLEPPELLQRPLFARFSQLPGRHGGRGGGDGDERKRCKSLGEELHVGWW